MMIRKLCLFIACLCMLFSISGCFNISGDSSEKVVSPQNKSIPLQGKWKIENCAAKKEMTSLENYSSKWSGQFAEFTSNSAALAENFWEDISYKVKRVNTQEYFLYKYKGPFENLGIKDKEIYVVTVSSGDKFLYDFVKIDHDKLLAYLDDGFYCLSKVSEKVDGPLSLGAQGMLENRNSSLKSEDRLLRTGLLLGIRTPAKEAESNTDSPENYNYRTLWISSINREVRPVLEANDIFLPRKSGFWKVEVKKPDETKRTEDILLAYSISDINSTYKLIDSLNPGFWNNREGILRKKILYVGNDYISVESIGKGKMKNGNQTWQENRLQTLPVDKISNSRGIKLSDIAGANGTMAVTGALEELAKASNAKDIKVTGLENLEENFALFRKTGHWFMKGRINFQQEEPVSFTDFTINLIPPAELVAYDVLHVPWTYIKDKIPQSTDAYTSPNKDLVVVVTGKQLLIYALNGDRISDEPVRAVQLQDGDTIVMAEWALGEYMENWKKTFVKNNATREIAR